MKSKPESPSGPRVETPLEHYVKDPSLAGAMPRPQLLRILVRCLDWMRAAGVGDKSKWRVHVIGPDDMYDHKNELEALRMANELNSFLARDRIKHANDPNHPFAMAVVEKNGIEYTKESELPAVEDVQAIYRSYQKP